VLFGLAAMHKTFEKAVELAKRPIKIVYIKETQAESLPAGGIDFFELIETSSIDLNSLVKFDRDIHEVAMLPYSR